MPTALVICCLSPAPLRFRQRFQLEVSVELQVGLESWSPLSLVSWPQVISSKNTCSLVLQELHTWATSCVVPAHPTSMTLTMLFSLTIPLSGALLIHLPISAQRPPPPESLPETPFMHALLSRPPLTAIAHGPIIRASHFHHRWKMVSSFQAGSRLLVPRVLIAEYLLKE